MLDNAWKLAIDQLIEAGKYGPGYIPAVGPLTLDEPLKQMTLHWTVGHPRNHSHVIGTTVVLASGVLYQVPQPNA